MGPGAAHTACCVQGVSEDSSQLVFSRLAARGIRRGRERWAREGVKLLNADTMAAIVWSWAEGGGGRHVLEAVCGRYFGLIRRAPLNVVGFVLGGCWARSGFRWHFGFFELDDGTVWGSWGLECSGLGVLRARDSPQSPSI
jgi:hypothetical protein